MVTGDRPELLRELFTACCLTYVSNNSLTPNAANVLSLFRLGPVATCLQETGISNPQLWARRWGKDDQHIPEPDLHACWGAFSYHHRSSISSSLPAGTWNRFPSHVFLCRGPWGSILSRIPSANRCKDLKIEDALLARKVCTVDLKHLSYWVHVWRCWQSVSYWQMQPRVFLVHRRLCFVATCCIVGGLCLIYMFQRNKQGQRASSYIDDRRVYNRPNFKFALVFTRIDIFEKHRFIPIFCIDLEMLTCMMEASKMVLMDLPFASTQIHMSKP